MLRSCATESPKPRSVSSFSGSRRVEAETRPKRDGSSLVAKGVEHSSRSACSSPWPRERSAGSGRRPFRSMMILNAASSIARALSPIEFRTA